MESYDLKKQLFVEKALATMKEQASDDEFSARMGYSYLIGVYLAINALKDAWCIIEGPDCAYMKAQYVQGNHDLMSTLTSVSGYHRIVNTALHPAMMIDSREPPLRDLLMNVGSNDQVKGLFISSMPMAFITGADYERLCRDVREGTGKETIHVPGLSLQGDWLDGYSETLKSLARQLDLPEVPDKNPRDVGIVGYLWDRNEDDHKANLRELKEMFKALDLNLVSVWLSGQEFGELKDISKAGTIISMPYARRAASLLARRTGADLIKLPLPFGLTATEEWVRTLGEHFDRKDAAEAYIDLHMSDIAPKLEWLIPFSFQNMSCGFVGDPHLFKGLVDIVETLGGRLAFGIVTNKPIHAKEYPELTGRPEVVVYPRAKSFSYFASAHALKSDANLVVANNHGLAITLKGSVTIEFGFPCAYTHTIYDRPFLGFRGFLAFVDTLANQLRMKEVELAKPVIQTPADDDGELPENFGQLRLR